MMHLHLKAVAAIVLLVAIHAHVDALTVSRRLFRLRSRDAAIEPPVVTTSLVELAAETKEANVRPVSKFAQAVHDYHSNFFSANSAGGEGVDDAEENDIGDVTDADSMSDSKSGSIGNVALLATGTGKPMIGDSSLATNEPSKPVASASTATVVTQKNEATVISPHSDHTVVQPGPSKSDVTSAASPSTSVPAAQTNQAPVTNSAPPSHAPAQAPAAQAAPAQTSPTQIVSTAKGPVQGTALSSAGAAPQTVAQPAMAVPNVPPTRLQPAMAVPNVPPTRLQPIVASYGDLEIKDTAKALAGIGGLFAEPADLTRSPKPQSPQRVAVATSSSSNSPLPLSYPSPPGRSPPTVTPNLDQMAALNYQQKPLGPFPAQARPGLNPQLAGPFGGYPSTPAMARGEVRVQSPPDMYDRVRSYESQVLGIQPTSSDPSATKTMFSPVTSEAMALSAQNQMPSALSDPIVLRLLGGKAPNVCLLDCRQIDCGRFYFSSPAQYELCIAGCGERCYTAEAVRALPPEFTGSMPSNLAGGGYAAYQHQKPPVSPVSQSVGFQNHFGQSTGFA